MRIRKNLISYIRLDHTLYSINYSICTTGVHGCLLEILQYYSMVIYLPKVNGSSTI